LTVLERWAFLARTENGAMIQHATVRVEYGLQGRTLGATIQHFANVSRRSAYTGATRHEDEYHAVYSRELFPAGFSDFTRCASRSSDKDLAMDFTVRDLAAERRQAQEQEIAPGRSVESPQPRQRGISDDDLAAAIERHRQRQAAEEERAQKRSRGRGAGAGCEPTKEHRVSHLHRHQPDRRIGMRLHCRRFFRILGPVVCIAGYSEASH
jgi:hypothetical protein